MASKTLIASAVLVLVAAGCGKKGTDASGSSSGAAASTSAAGTGSAASSSSEDALEKVEPNGEIVTLLKKVVEGCTVSDDQATAHSCKNKETDGLSTLAREKKPADLYVTLAETALQNLEGNKKLANAALSAFADLWSSLDEPTRKANATKQTALRAVKLLEKLGGEKETRGARIAGVAAQVAILGGKKDALFAAVNASKNDYLHEGALAHSMTFGRLDVMPEVEAAAKAPKESWARGALQAPRNMPKPTAAEKAKICPWAKGYIGSEKLPVAVEAGHDMVFCGGEYVNALLDEGEARLKAKKYTNELNFVFRDICFSFAGEKPAGAAAQCERNFKFLEAVANDESVPDVARGLALWSIYYQRRDKTSLELMRRYEGHKNAEISKRAKEAIKSLEETYKLK